MVLLCKHVSIKAFLQNENKRMGRKAMASVKWWSEGQNLKLKKKNKPQTGFAKEKVYKPDHFSFQWKKTWVDTPMKQV